MFLFVLSFLDSSCSSAFSYFLWPSLFQVEVSDATLGTQARGQRCNHCTLRQFPKHLRSCGPCRYLYAISRQGIERRLRHSRRKYEPPHERDDQIKSLKSHLDATVSCLLLRLLVDPVCWLGGNRLCRWEVFLSDLKSALILGLFWACHRKIIEAILMHPDTLRVRFLRGISSFRYVQRWDLCTSGAATLWNFGSASCGGTLSRRWWKDLQVCDFWLAVVCSSTSSTSFVSEQKNDRLLKV